MLNRLLSYLICLACFSGVPGSVQCRSLLDNQDTLLSLNEVIEHAEVHLQKREYDTAEGYIERAEKLAQHQKNRDLSFKVYDLKFTLLQNTAKYEEARALSECQEKKDLTNTQLASVQLDLYEIDHRTGSEDRGYPHLIKAKNLIGNDSISHIGIKYLIASAKYHILTLDYVNAFEEYFSVLMIYEKMGEEPTIEVLHNLAGLFQNVYAYELSLDLDKKNFERAVQLKNIRAQIFTLYSMSSSLMYLERYAEAINACRKAIEISKSSGMTIAVGYSYAILGRCLLELDRPQEAIQAVQEGLEISKIQKERKEIADCYLTLGLIYTHLGQFEQSLEYTIEANAYRNYFDIEIIDLLSINYKNLDIKDNYLETLEIISDYYKNQNQSSGYYKMITQLIEDKFSTETDQIKTTLEESSRKKLINLGFTSASIVLSILLFFIIRQRILNKKLVRLNKDLLKRNEDLKQFTYITSHDLKEPIRNVKSFAGLIDLKLKKHDIIYDEIKDFTGFISNSASTLFNIVETLRVYTNVSNVDSSYQKVNINELLLFIQEDLRNVYKEKNSNILISNDLETEFIWFNAEMLQLVLRNLICNGIIHNDKDHPEVNVHVLENQNEYIFKVEDNGPGISKEYHAKIFEPFKTLNNKSYTHSSGLGLSICKTILDRYQGKIWLESEVSKGCTFIISIPKQEITKYSREALFAKLSA